MSNGHILEPKPTIPDVDRQIFESHFSKAFNEIDYERAKTIFDAVGAANERGLAIQFHVATQVGKLEEVLAAYEKLIAPDSWYYLVPTAVQKAVEVRLYKDVLYTSVILEGEDISAAMRIMEEVDVPKIFDLMGVQ